MPLQVNHQRSTRSITVFAEPGGSLFGPSSVSVTPASPLEDAKGHCDTCVT